MDDRRSSERIFDAVMSFFAPRGKLLSVILAGIVVCSALALTFYAGAGFRNIYGKDIFIRPFLVAVLLVLLASIQAGHLNGLKKIRIGLRNDEEIKVRRVENTFRAVLVAFRLFSYAVPVIGARVVLSGLGLGGEDVWTFLDLCEAVMFNLGWFLMIGAEVSSYDFRQPRN